MYRPRGAANAKMLVKSVWGPHDVATWEEADWLVGEHPRELAAYVESLRATKPQAYKGFLTNFNRALDRIEEALRGRQEE